MYPEIMIPKILLCAIFIANVVNCANILILSVTPWFSHEIALLDVWKEMQARGHNITMVTHFPEVQKTSNFKIIDVSSLRKELEDSGLFRSLSEFSKWKFTYAICKATKNILDSLLGMPQMQDLIQNRTKYKFDVVIVEMFYESLFAFSKLFNCPLVTFTTIDMHEVLHWHIGNQLNHVTLPDMNAGLHQATDFSQRLESALFTIVEFLHHYLVFQPDQNELIRKYFGGIGVTTKELRENIDLLLVNANPMLRTVRALVPTTVMIGGGNHIHPPKALPEELKTYLDSATNGFIYLSLGTIVRSDNIGSDLLDVLVEVMRKLPYKILWKIEEDSLQEKPANVRTIGWAPQQDILRHPNIKLFISQGGIQSIEEAIFSNVPMLVIPFFGDQHKNAQLVTAKGIGLSVQHKPELDKVELESTIYELIKNPMYKNTARRLATLMNDTYMTGLEKSIWWIEYVIRNNGTKELRNPAAKLPFYQYYALDVIGFIVLCIVVTIKLLVVLTRSIFRILTSQDSSRRRKEKKM